MCLNAVVQVVLLACLLGIIFASTTEKTICSRGYWGEDGYAPCSPCPKGRYGLVSGMTSSLCSAACPAGKWSNKWAAVSEDDCRDCPRNSYSTSIGTTSEHCTACAFGKFSTGTGMSTSGACQPCETGYLDNYCIFDETLAGKGTLN